MREIKIYKLEELSEEARKKAIKEYRESKNDDGSLDHEALLWALDDCSLFEPPHQEMVEILGENYYEENGNQFVFKNTRGGVRADWDPYSMALQIEDALEITNDRMFLLWLGFPEVFISRLEPYEIISRNDWTYIELKTEIQSENILLEPINFHIKMAVMKFKTHMERILNNIENSFEEYFNEDNLGDRISESGLEFFEDGTIFKI